MSNRIGISITLAGAALVAAGGTLASGCTGTGTDDLPPGGFVSHFATYYAGALSEADAYAEFYSEFEADDPNADPTVNPYDAIEIGECVDPILESAPPAITYLDVGETVTLEDSENIALSKQVDGSDIFYVGTLTTANISFNTLYDVNLSGSAEVANQTFPSALASGSPIEVTAPAGFDTGDVVLPATGAQITYATVLSEVIMVLIIHPTDPADGKLCRVDPGTGGATTFNVPDDVMTAVPDSGILAVFSFTHGTEDLDGRRIGLFGTTLALASYSKQ